MGVTLMFKTTCIAAVFTAGLTVAASAGGMAEPVMEPEIMIETMEETSSAAGVLPLIIFAMLVAVASGS